MWLGPATDGLSQRRTTRARWLQGLADPRRLSLRCAGAAACGQPLGWSIQLLLNLVTEHTLLVVIVSVIGRRWLDLSRRVVAQQAILCAVYSM